jgi:hypothetical protein
MVLAVGGLACSSCGSEAGVAPESTVAEASGLSVPASDEVDRDAVGLVGDGDAVPPAGSAGAARGVQGASGLAARLGWSEQVLGCVGDRLGPDFGQLVESAAGDSGQEASVVLREAGSECQEVLEWGPAFAASMDEASGGRLSDEQVACLERAWAALDRVVIDELVAGAVVADRQSPAAIAAVGEIRERCAL